MRKITKKHTKKNNVKKNNIRKNKTTKNNRNKRGGMGNVEFSNLFASKPTTEQIISNEYLDNIDNKQVFIENIEALSYIDPATWKLLIRDGIDQLRYNSDNAQNVNYDEKEYINRLQCKKYDGKVNDAKYEVDSSKTDGYDGLFNKYNNGVSSLQTSVNKKIEEDVKKTCASDVAQIEKAKQKLLEEINKLKLYLDSERFIIEVINKEVIGGGGDTINNTTGQSSIPEDLQKLKDALIKYNDALVDIYYKVTKEIKKGVDQLNVYNPKENKIDDFNKKYKNVFDENKTDYDNYKAEFSTALTTYNNEHPQSKTGIVSYIINLFGSNSNASNEDEWKKMSE